jgi:hypothetical protein
MGCSTHLYLKGENDMPNKKVKGISGLELSQCYRTSDGEIFDSVEEAKRHQIRYNFCENLTKHLERPELDTPQEDIAIITDAIMEDLDGMAIVFERYLYERKQDV